MSERDVRALLPLRPRVFGILLALAEGPRHGYGIMRELSDEAGAGWMLGPGTLYRTLKEMQQAGLITATSGPTEESDGPPRRYYQLTGFGKRVAVAEAGRMRGLVSRAVLLLGNSK
jgi:DNA-binding PadR family transcriptional regulator